MAWLEYRLLGIHGCGCTNRNCNERCVLGNEAQKGKNRQTEKGLITSHRHYTKIHIETQTAARRQKKKAAVADLSLHFDSPVNHA